MRPLRFLKKPNRFRYTRINHYSRHSCSCLKVFIDRGKKKKERNKEEIITGTCFACVNRLHVGTQKSRVSSSNVEKVFSIEFNTFFFFFFLRPGCDTCTLGTEKKFTQINAYFRTTDVFVSTCNNCGKMLLLIMQKK